MRELTRNSCRLCGASNMEEVIDLGRLPIAHRLLNARDTQEERFPMRLDFCPECGFFQIKDPVDPEILYRDYNFCFTDWKPQPHIHEEADIVASAAEKGSVVEVGANDGKFLTMLMEKGVGKVIGIEPNNFARAEALKKGLEVSSDMLTAELAEALRVKHGPFRVFVARQVIEHLLDIEDFFRSADILLEDNGCLFIDIPDFMCGLSTGDCSMLWEEHPNYFTEDTLISALRRNGYEPEQIRRYNFSGGTVAVLARRTGKRDILPAPEGYAAFAGSFKERVSRYENQLKKTLSHAREKGFTIALYGTGCRACTTVNGLSLGEFIDFSIDDQTEKLGMFMPGSGLEICPLNSLREIQGKLLVLLAVNQENEEKVSRKVQDITGTETVLLSIQCPKDILAHLQTVARSSGL